MFNVVGVPRMAFASIQSQRLDDPSVLGRIKSEGFVRKADGRQVHKGMGHLLTGLLSRAAAANLTGTWRKSPFFGEDGKPAKPIKQLTKEDVAHLS
ncbi:hypothetical protein KIN_29760 [Litoreibacter roseus]|uniref:Uncharacterized protein n=2 Tax=Litoreibacter roseus TaxID=2601869 RepID=A0A6N6JL38_9RHOB|nr:hypothetical protein KIN_29760 [Litoreibacter roseus]